MTPILRTERLVLEPYTPADEESFVALFTDPGFSRWLGDGPSPEAENRALFWRVFPVYEQQRFDVWAVRRDGELIGHAEIKPTRTSGGYEIIYALAPAAWGQGLGTELAAALVDYSFDTLGLTEIHATVAAPNHGSLAVLRKVGFTHMRDITAKDGSTTRVLTRHRIGNDTPAVLRQQLHIAWSLTELAVAGLTDDECHWLPAPGAWTVRRTGGAWVADWAQREPDPPPAASIGWLTWHIDMWWSMVHAHSFGAGNLTPEQVTWAGDATAAAARIGACHAQWSAALDTLGERDLAGTTRTRWPYPDARPFTHVVAWVNLELMKNAAEISQLRRLYRNR